MARTQMPQSNGNLRNYHTMNSLLKSSVSSVTLALFLSSSAYATDLRPMKDSPSSVLDAPVANHSWQGPYIGVGVGYRWQSWDKAAECILVLDESKKTRHGGHGDDADECGDAGRGHRGHWEYDAAGAEDADSFIITGRAGYDWQSGSIVFGAFGEVNWLNANTDHFADAELSYAVGARAGFLVNPRLLAYLNAGVELTDFNGLDTLTAPFVGAGLELMIADGWTVAPELRMAFEKDGDLPSGASKDDPITARILLLKKF